MKYLVNQIKRGLEIRYTKDIGPYTSTINSLINFRNDLIVTADDDVIYSNVWLEDLYHSFLTAPEHIHCHLARMMKKDSSNKVAPYAKWSKGYEYFEGPSPNIFPFTVGGCLFPPNIFSDEVFNAKVFLKLCPYQDDLWFKAMALLNNINCTKVRPFSIGFPQIRNTQQESLFQYNVLEGGNDRAVKAVFDHYDLYDRLEF